MVREGLAVVAVRGNMVVRIENWIEGVEKEGGSEGKTEDLISFVVSHLIFV